ncbi:phospholipase [Microbacterium sp. 179-I 3D4 NHS]|uniref:aggregation-promoting factor C-terminal-like domain-containing protein n=1 Tax=Microbacterium sp. 179-I 3D4 NHS TaxID=3142381 RepID=UPI0039A2E929
MLHHPHTRASRRAHEAASALSAVRSRRPALILTAAVGAALGAALTAGLVSAPAAGAERADLSASGAAAKVAWPSSHMIQVPDQPAKALRTAQDSLTAAEALNADVAASGLDLGATPTAVDTAALQEDMETLAERAETPALELAVVAVEAESRSQEVAGATAELQTAFSAAQEKKAAEDAAAAAIAQAEAEAAALAAANTPDGAKATARSMAASTYGWGDDQFSCLNSLWQKESSWNYRSYNGGSGATGIPQALPGSKMASAGSDWETNAATQIAWGLGYISSVYGTPCSAWGHSQATDWY